MLLQWPVTDKGEANLGVFGRDRRELVEDLVQAVSQSVGSGVVDIESCFFCVIVNKRQVLEKFKICPVGDP